MGIRKLAVEFVTVFSVTLITVALVTFLWNVIGHGESAVATTDMPQANMPKISNVPDYNGSQILVDRFDVE